MDTRLNYIFVGVFVLGLGAAFIMGVLWLSGGDVRVSYDRYLMYTGESVSGLGVDSPVRYRGVQVGRVVDISIPPDDPSRVRLVLDLRAGTPVKTDTVATLEMQGLTGLMAVNLIGGSPEATRPLPGPEGWPVIPSRPSVFGRLEQQAAVLADKITMTTERLNRLLDDRNREAFAQILGNLETITADLANQSGAVARILADTQRIAGNAKAASEGLPGLIGQFRASADAIERMADNFASTSDTVRTEVRSSGEQMRRFVGETLPETGAVVEELRATAANLRRASELIERDPSVLVYGAPAHTPGPGE